MNNFKITRILLIVVITIGGIYMLSPEYIRNALVYQFPDIDDYKKFDNRTVISAGHHPWDEEPGFDRKEPAPGYADVLEGYKTSAYLVIQNEKIIFEKYWGKYNKETLSGGFSMSKSIIGLLIGIAIDKGYIESVDQELGDYFPSFSNPAYKALTIKNLLEMSSGFGWDDSYKSPFSKTAESYYGNDLTKLALEQEIASQPGVVFSYQNINTQILAMVLQKASNLSVSAFASLHLWKPLGASGDALWSLDEINGVEKAFTGFNATARDFARFGQLILNKGEWKGNKIVSEDYIDMALKPADHLIDKKGRPLKNYGLHWWMHEHDGLVVYSMRGYKGQYVLVVPDKNLVVVRLGNKSGKEIDENFTSSDIPKWLEIALHYAG